MARRGSADHLEVNGAVRRQRILENVTKMKAVLLIIGVLVRTQEMFSNNICKLVHNLRGLFDIACVVDLVQPERQFDAWRREGNYQANGAVGEMS